MMIEMSRSYRKPVIKGSGSKKRQERNQRTRRVQKQAWTKINEVNAQDDHVVPHKYTCVNQYDIHDWKFVLFYGRRNKHFEDADPKRYRRK